MRWSFCLSSFLFGDWWLRYISVGLTSISGICFWRLAFTLTELSGFVSASRSFWWRRWLLTGIPGYRWLTLPFVTRSTVSLLTSLFDVWWIVDDWIIFEVSIWCAARIFGKIALSEVFFIIRLIDFRWFTGISWKTSPSVEISGGFSVKQHVSSAVRVLTLGSSPVNGKLRLESHGGGLEEVFDVLDACRFHFFFSIHVDKKMTVLELLSFFWWFSWWAMYRPRGVMLPCLWAFRFPKNLFWADVTFLIL